MDNANDLRKNIADIDKLTAELEADDNLPEMQRQQVLSILLRRRTALQDKINELEAEED